MYKMDSRGGCCIARYAGGGGVYDMSKVNRIMLRFRPIAPKPSTGGSVSPPGNTGEVSTKSGRGRRKYTRENNNNKRCNNSNKKRKASSSEEKTTDSSVVTLPLLPDSPARSSSQMGPQQPPQDKDVPNNMKSPTWLSFDKNQEYLKAADRTAVVKMPQAVRVVGSCVTVECVTDTWVDGDGLGCTDLEKRMNLERDSCPGFISDEFGRVTWTNEAYRRVVGQEEGEEMVVWLVMKVPVTTVTPAFTCRMRLQYSYGKEKSSLTLPCDVWRMDGGGFAWRLDVKAALCLGR